MNHDKIEREDVVERYVMGKLSPQEAALFEEHFFGCRQCFEEVKETRQVVSAVKTAVQEGLLIEPTTERSTLDNLLARLKSLFSNPRVSIAMAGLVLALLYPAWQGMVTVSRLENQIAQLRRPQANLLHQQLQSRTRRSAPETVPAITLSSPDEIFILTFNVIDTAKSYRAEIVNQQGRIVWQGHDLKGGEPFEAFSIACHGSFFQEENYALKVYGSNEPDLFAFKIVFKK